MQQYWIRNVLSSACVGVAVLLAVLLAVSSGLEEA
jgi:hypothetical protein